MLKCLWTRHSVAAVHHHSCYHTNFIIEFNNRVAVWLCGRRGGWMSCTALPPFWLLTCRAVSEEVHWPTEAGSQCTYHHLNLAHTYLHECALQLTAILSWLIHWLLKQIISYAHSELHSNRLISSYQLLNLAWGCFRHVLSNVKTWRWILLMTFPTDTKDKNSRIHTVFVVLFINKLNVSCYLSYVYDGISVQSLHCCVYNSPLLSEFCTDAHTQRT